MKKIKNEFALFKYIGYNKFKLIFYIIFMTGFYLCNVISTLLIAQGIEFITLEDWGTAFLYFGISTAVLLFSRLLEVLAEIMYARLVRDISTALRNDLTKRMFSISSMCFNQNSAGLFVTRITNSPVNAINSLGSLIESLGDLISFSVTIIYIACLNVYMGLMMIGVFIILALFENFKVRIYAKNQKVQKKEYDNVTSYSNEIVRSEKDIKSLNLEGKLKETSVEVYDKVKNAQYKCYSTDAKLWNLRTAIVFVCSFLIVWFAFSLKLSGVLATAGLLYVFMNCNDIGGAVWNIGNIIRNLADVKVEAQRIGQVFDEKNFPTEKFGKTRIETKDFKGKITFKNVSFGYAEMDYDSLDEIDRDNVMNKKKRKIQPKKKEEVKNMVVKNLSFCVRPGQTVAFVGRSGSGKSTILSLIPKLYECDKGEVLIDNVNVKELSKETLRENIALVNQFPYIFNATIRENMLMAKKDATDEEIIAMLKKASLWDFVSGLKKGLSTVVGENGVKLSGGQRQRLAIARALLRNSKIIIFDESTSSLDNFAQEEVRKSIDSLQGERTVVIVAHRLSTIKNADVIFFLEKGKIIAKGTFEELYKNVDKFKAMFIAENLEN